MSSTASPFTTFFSNLWNNFKTQEAQALLPIAAKASANIANNPTTLNFLSQVASAAAQAEAAQPGILQAELQQVSALLQEIAASVATPPTASAAAPATAGA